MTQPGRKGISPPARSGPLQTHLAEYFRQTRTRVLRPQELALLLREKQNAWRLPSDLSRSATIDLLVANTDLTDVDLPSENEYPSLRRYVWGRASAYEVALSLRADCYLSHETAMFLHGLTERRPKTIYVNQEQSEKPKTTGGLTQEAINRAFAARSQRHSRYSFLYDGTRMVVISGKNTGRFGVDLAGSAEGLSVPATKLARTLVDIVVRPAYAGGVGSVMQAFRMAKGRAPVSEILKTLHRLGHLYPFHQALGFYMERAGYPAKELLPLRGMGLKFDFYLDYGLKNCVYDRRWRVSYPKGL